MFALVLAAVTKAREWLLSEGSHCRNGASFTYKLRSLERRQCKPMKRALSSKSTDLPELDARKIAKNQPDWNSLTVRVGSGIPDLITPEDFSILRSRRLGRHSREW